MLKHKLKNKQIIKSKYKVKQLVILFILIICFTSLITVFGRYVIKNINNFFIRTKEFYFYSDKLKENNAIYQVNNWSGTGNYLITINMNSRRNNLLATSYDIGYNITYTCSSNAICQLSKTTGIIYSSTNADSFTLTITPNTALRTGDTVWVKITATSTAQYQKTLTAEFTLVVGQENLSYEIVDSVGSQYLDLNITNTLSYYTVAQAFGSYQVGNRIDAEDYLLLSDTDKAKCYSMRVAISFNPNTVLMDMTNSNYLKATNITTQAIGGYNYINGITFLVDAISSTTVRLYKKDVEQNYTYPSGSNPSIVTVTSI